MAIEVGNNHGRGAPLNGPCAMKQANMTRGLWGVKQKSSWYVWCLLGWIPLYTYNAYMRCMCTSFNGRACFLCFYRVPMTSNYMTSSALYRNTTSSRLRHLRTGHWVASTSMTCLPHSMGLSLFDVDFTLLLTSDVIAYVVTTRVARKKRLRPPSHRLQTTLFHLASLGSSSLRPPWYRHHVPGQRRLLDLTRREVKYAKMASNGFFIHWWTNKFERKLAWLCPQKFISLKKFHWGSFHRGFNHLNMFFWRCCNRSTT